MSIDFARQVAIAKGAGGRLGRAYALDRARNRAALRVNDYGGGLLGGHDGAPAPDFRPEVAQGRYRAG